MMAVWYYRAPIFDWIRIFWDREAIQAFLQGFGLWGPIILFLLILVQLFIAFIPGHLLVAASGYIYGAPLTITVVSTSAILGSQLAFLLARKYGRPLIYRIASQKAIERWDKIAGDRGPLFYIFMFVLPFVPSDMMCYIAGLGNISFKRFLAANLIGRLWATTETAVIGSYAFQPPLWFWILLAVSLVGLYSGWLIYDKYNQPSANK
jgi:uncharacterized membrane protein YdjX (TVP38/TMEM64 family)